MIKTKTIQTDKVTDRDMFNYITQQMLKQGVKSQDQWYNEEDGIVEDGDTCQYFGYDMRTDTSLRCAVGWVMNKEVFREYEDQTCEEIEGNGISTTSALEVVILSNENWAFANESWIMLSIMQRIHDNLSPEQWRDAFNNMSYMFNSEGSFCPSYIVKNTSGDHLNHDELYKSCDGGEELNYVDFEYIGISYAIKNHNGRVVGSISNVIESDEFMDCLDPKVIGSNILDAENQETSDVSAKNFLDIADAIRLAQKQEELILNANT